MFLKRVENRNFWMKLKFIEKWMKIKISNVAKHYRYYEKNWMNENKKLYWNKSFHLKNEIYLGRKKYFYEKTSLFMAAKYLRYLLSVTYSMSNIMPIETSCPQSLPIENISLGFPFIANKLLFQSINLTMFMFYYLVSIRTSKNHIVTY